MFTKFKNLKGEGYLYVNSKEVLAVVPLSEGTRLRLTDGNYTDVCESIEEVVEVFNMGCSSVADLMP